LHTRELTLVPGETPRPARGGARRSTPALLGAFVLVAAGLATWLDAGKAREVVEVQDLAERTLQTALQRGSEDDAVRAALVDLRTTLGQRPLDSKTRVVYASLVLGLATRVDDMDLAAFHARRAAELSPVTVSVVRAAAVVLASTGEIERALELIRRMFAYDPTHAASTLSQIGSLVIGVRIADGIPATPDAWLAWALRVEEVGRGDDADAWLRRTLERWPDHLPTRVRAGALAFARGDWEALGRLLARPDPREPAAAPLFLWRAHLAWRAGDLQTAVQHVETALALAPDRSTRVSAGDLFLEMGQVARARTQWNRALYETDHADAAARRPLLERLARLEEEHGEPGTALRLWQAVLEIDAQHEEARRHVDDLAGFER